jgi:hypothetical protein
VVNICGAKSGCSALFSSLDACQMLASNG